MSKTQKTRPWRLRATAQPGWTCVPVHDHRFADCTLPEDPAAPGGFGVHTIGACYWTEGPGFFYGPDGGCGCPHCTGQLWRRAERRAVRHAANQVCRDAARAFRTGLPGGDPNEADFDDYVPAQPRWF